MSHVLAGTAVSLQTTQGPDPSGMTPVVIITRAHLSSLGELPQLEFALGSSMYRCAYYN